MTPADLLISARSISPELIGNATRSALFNMASDDGQNEASAPVYNGITGVTANTVIHGAIVFTTKADIATASVRPGSDFTAGEGSITVTANPANNTNNQLIFFFSN